MTSMDFNIPAKTGVKPSIFEVFAVDSLSNGLRTGFEFLLKVLSENHPDRYGLVYRYCSEFHTVFNLCVQHYCLKTYNASFAENFYGLKRISSRSFGKLHRHEMYRSLLLLVGVPYLKSLLDQHYKNEKEIEESGNIQECNGSVSKLRLLFIRIYPFVHLVAQTLSVTYQLMYAVGKLKHPSIELCLSSTELRAQTGEELLETSDTKNSLQQRWYQHLRNFPEILLHMTASGLSTGVSFGAFFLQFIDWWYNREGVTYSFQPLPIPPPPSKYPSELDSGNCPLCIQRINCETLLTTSGFVFCFRCIYPYVENFKVCPVTRLPSTTDHLIRLYIPTE